MAAAGEKFRDLGRKGRKEKGVSEACTAVEGSVRSFVRSLAQPPNSNWLSPDELPAFIFHEGGPGTEMRS